MLSEKIKELRVQRGLSQEELGNCVAVVRQTVSKWEKGLSVPDSVTLVRIAQALDVSPSDLLSHVEDSDAPTAATSPTPTAETPAKRSATSTALILLGSPLWFSLALAAAAVALAVYLSLWAILIALWAVFGALVGGTLGGLAAGIVFFCTGHLPTGLVVLAGGFVCAGLAILIFFGCKGATKGLLRLTAAVFRWGNAHLRKKEGAI